MGCIAPPSIALRLKPGNLIVLGAAIAVKLESKLQALALLS